MRGIFWLVKRYDDGADRRPATGGEAPVETSPTAATASEGSTGTLRAAPTDPRLRPAAATGGGIPVNPRYRAAIAGASAPSPARVRPVPAGGVAPGPAPAARPARRRTRLIAAIGVLAVLAGVGAAVGTYYVDSVPTPQELTLPQSTTVYFADGKTPMAKLGVENRTILSYDEMTDAVKQAIVAAEDQTFWTNKGVDFGSVLRAAWNNLTGGERQGGSTITQQYARIAADLKGVTYSRKLREAVIAWKLDDKYPKKKILEFYLNTVPFGRGAYGIEAAAQAFFGKTANRNAPAASQLTVAEAMLLAGMVKQPEADPDDPQGRPGYDPTRGPTALENSKARWNYVRDGMVKLGYLSRADADALTYPDTVKPFDPTARQSGLDLPTGLVVNHVLSELRQAPEFKGKPAEYIDNGGFRIVTTIDKRAQEVAEAAADIRRPTTPEALRGQPRNWQAALVAVEPGTGRVLAYYGGSQGSGADYAGWYHDTNGEARGFGEHPPGSSFKVYDLAEAIRQNVSVKSHWDTPASKEFPASGRTNGSPAGPVRNASTAKCQPDCMLWEATVASLNVAFFDLTEHIGAGNIIEMAAKAGVDSMWATEPGKPDPVRVDLRSKPGSELIQRFSTEVGIGQYGITVLDHANGMATFAAGGKRADVHFVRSVSRAGDEVYTEKVKQTDIGLNAEQINQLNWTLSQVEAAKLNNGWDSAGKTGTWQAGQSITDNAHTWMVGYTRALAAAVWLGTTDGGPLITKDGGHNVFGANYPGPIWRQFMTDATAAMKLDKRNSKFTAPKFPSQSASLGTRPPVTQRPTTAGATPPTTSTCQPTCPSPKPTAGTTRPASSSPSGTAAPAAPSRSARRRARRRGWTGPARRRQRSH